jgi:hypothetical protein
MVGDWVSLHVGIDSFFAHKHAHLQGIDLRPGISDE